MSDSYAFEYGDIGPNPHVVLDNDGLVILRQLLVVTNIFYELSYDVYAMVTGDDGWPWSEYYIFANDARSLSTIYD